MKIGNILYNIYTTAVAVSFFAGLAYLAVAGSVTFVQEKKYNFGSKVEASNIEYEGRSPYSPIIPLHFQDRNGYAKVWLRGDKHVFLKYDDLTAPSLEGKIMLIDSEGEEAEFDENAEYDPETRKDAEDLKRALETAGSDKSISDIVEEEIRQALQKDSL